MRICYFVLLFVIFSQAMTFTLKKIKTAKISSKQKCEKIKCPPIEDPVCVKIKNKDMKEVYVIAINKCEIKYASCLKDVDAVIVPMGKCRHNIEKNQNIRSKRHKRDVDENSSEDLSNDRPQSLKGQSEDNDNEDHELLKGQSEDNDNEDHELLKGQSEDNDNEDHQLLEGQLDDDESEDHELLKGDSGDHENEDDQFLKGQSEDSENEDKELLKGDSEDNKNEDQEKSDSDDNKNEDQELLKGESDDNENEDEELLQGDPENKVKEDSSEAENKSDLDANVSEGSKKLEKKMNLNNEDVHAQSETDENDNQKPILVENVAADYDQHNEEVDLVQNNKTCPTVCPSRDVMVCAKCQHNIHRSFLSSCHLRMFACKHTEEKLTLVQRAPCVQSAPYISEFKETKGRIPESGELDEVHKFIFCRDKKLLNKDDPRCRFVGTKEEEER